MALKSVEYKNKSFEIAYDILNATFQNTIVFLHGWGSNKEIMKQAFSKTLPNFKHIYLDMPGFGKSSNEEVLTTKDYANIVKSFLSELNIKDDCTIAGHSFGGKVATLLNPKNLVLLSSAGILEEKPFKVKFKISLAKVLNSLGLKNITKAFRSKDVENMNQGMYETFKNVVNEDFTKEFSSFKGNAYIFWGEQDCATSLDSGKQIARLIPNSKFVSYGGDHYFFIKNAQNITQRLEDGIL